MKWIVLAILVVLVPYTFLTLRYRKPGPAFQPYEDLKNRANVSRLLAAGYQRIQLTAHQPAEPEATLAPVSTARIGGGIPSELKSTLVEPPVLPADILAVSAPPTANTLRSYPVRFTCLLPDDGKQLAGADLYLKDDRIHIIPTFERLAGELLSRTREPVVQVTIPPGTLAPGSYVVTLSAERSARQWKLEVR